jgi:hypothetical protein
LITVVRCVLVVVSGESKVTFGALPNFPLTVTASEAVPGEAQASGVADGVGVAFVAGLAAFDEEDDEALGVVAVQPARASGTSAAASATRRSGRRGCERIGPS